MSFSSVLQDQSTIDEMIVGDTPLSNKDLKRLEGHYLTVFNVVKDGRWRYPDQIAQETGVRLDSALRMLRLMKARGHGYRKNYEGNGLYAYQIIPSFNE